jgi:hypothetical protein
MRSMQCNVVLGGEVMASSSLIRHEPQRKPHTKQFIYKNHRVLGWEGRKFEKIA